MNKYNIKKYSINKYNINDIFNKDYNNKLIDSSSIIGYRRKRIKSGDYLEEEIYPIWNINVEGRTLRSKESTLIQKNLNNKNSVKNIIRLLNTNFTNNDIWVTFTYDDKHLPSSIEEAQKDMVNYIRRLKRYISKNKLYELKYIYVSVFNEKRAHHHIVLNFNNRDIVEQLWNKASRKHTRRLQPNDLGLEEMGRYIMKEAKVSKYLRKYVVSKNLIKPLISISDTIISKNKAFNLATNDISPKVLFERVNKGYVFNSIRVYVSDYVSGVYIYIKMYKMGKNDNLWKRLNSS